MKPSQYFARKFLAWGVNKKAALICPFDRASAKSSIEAMILMFSVLKPKTFTKYETVKEFPSQPIEALVFCSKLMSISEGALAVSIDDRLVV